MSARNLGPPGKRRGGPHPEAAHTVEVTTTDKTMVANDPVIQFPPRPSTYGLTPAELHAERHRCRAAGWRRWELLHRFGREAAA